MYEAIQPCPSKKEQDRAIKKLTNGRTESGKLKLQAGLT